MGSVPLSSNIMATSTGKFLNGWLIVRRIAWSDTEIKEDLNPHTFQGLLPATELLRFDEFGDAAGGTLAYEGEISPDETWLFQPTKVLFRYPSNPKKPNEMLIPLGDVSLNNLADPKSDRHSAFREALLRKVFADLEPWLLFPQNFLTILYLEPSARLLEIGASHDEILSVVQNLREGLGQANYVSIPQQFGDLLVFPGALGPNIQRDVLTIRIAPLNLEYSKPSVPNSILNLLNTMITITELEAFHEKLQQTSLLQKGPSLYLQSLTSNVNIRTPIFGMQRDKLLGEVYQGHLRERLEGAEIFRTARHLANKHERFTTLFSSNATRIEDDWLWTSACLCTNNYRYGMVAALREKLCKAGTEIRQSIVELEIRDRLSNDYVRDYFSAKVAQSNLDLQRIIYRLTVIAIIIALIALLPNLASLSHVFSY